MKRILAILAAVAAVLMLSNPALAASLGISPSRVEVSVPGDGSATADVQVHYFSGDLKVSLVDIPLRIEPEIINVDALDEPVDIQVTIYGDESLGSQVYNGYIRFLGMSGETVAVAIKIRAKVTNVVEGQPVPETSSGTLTEPEAAAPTPSLAGEPQSAAQNTPPVTPASQEQSGGIAGLPLNTVIIIGAGLVFIGLVALAISLAVRRPKY